MVGWRINSGWFLEVKKLKDENMLSEYARLYVCDDAVYETPQLLVCPLMD